MTTPYTAWCVSVPAGSRELTRWFFTLPAARDYVHLLQKQWRQTPETAFLQDTEIKVVKAWVDLTLEQVATLRGVGTRLQEYHGPKPGRVYDAAGW